MTNMVLMDWMKRSVSTEPPGRDADLDSNITDEIPGGGAEDKTPLTLVSAGFKDFKNQGKNAMVL